MVANVSTFHYPMGTPTHINLYRTASRKTPWLTCDLQEKKKLQSQYKFYKLNPVQILLNWIVFFSHLSGPVLGSLQPLLRTSHGSVLNVLAKRRTKNTRKGNTNYTETMQRQAHIWDIRGLEALTEHLWHCCKIKKLWLIVTLNDF